MRSWVALALAATLLGGCGDDKTPAAKAPAQLAAAPAYDSTLAEGIQFGGKPGYPRFIDSVAGMSGFEPGHRWTEGSTVTFRFAEDLPRSFVLKLDLAGAFGPNVDKPINVTVGDWRGQFSVGASAKSIELQVSTTQPARVLEFAIPEPASPKRLGVGDDARLVGIDFLRLRITQP